MRHTRGVRGGAFTPRRRAYIERSAAGPMRRLLFRARHATKLSPSIPPPAAPHALRRRVLAGAALGLAALAMPAAAARRPHRIGFFGVRPPESHPEVLQMARFREGLREHGLREGTGYRLEHVWERRVDRLDDRMRSLIESRPDLVVAITTPVALAAARATTTIPIVFGTVSDPVASGLVRSLAQPGGNVTGVANVLPALSGKLVELAREILPEARRIAVLWNPDNPAKALELRELEAHAQRLGVECMRKPAHSAGEIDAALAGLAKARVAALVVLAETLTDAHRERMARLALDARLPTFFNHAPHVEAGGLAAYAPDYDLQTRRLGELAGRILSGEPPAKLPVEQPNRFVLMVNARTARSLGLELPRSVLLRADRVIE
jgi:putative tryptophan/tyrosine transport system substrate-binding protein